MSGECVNIFFATDNGYIPYLTVALTSLKENCNRKRNYKVRILFTEISENYIEKLKREFNEERFSVEFVDIRKSVEEISEKLHTRDYYSKTTYYRLFIPRLFPNLDKALYLDGDIVILGDISELYDTELHGNLVGAISDSFVSSSEKLKLYVTERVGVDSAENYFNAGVLLMNLSEMRKISFEEKFISLIDSVKFEVAQDQDYLNAICKGKTKKIGLEWNYMPNYSKNSGKRKLIHYNLDNKPWQKDGIPYGEFFWEYAKKSIFKNEIEKTKHEYTEELSAVAREQTERLIDAAYAEAKNSSENFLIKRKIAAVINA